MSRVLTFSRYFPSYHPRKGEDTFFVEQILNSIAPKTKLSDIDQSLLPIINDFAYMDGAQKHHTIRAGNRWKVGDKFSPRVWSGKPYCSKQITIAPDIEIKKVWEFEVQGNTFLMSRTRIVSMREIAENDGLILEDLLSWFNKPFTGQIICWNENINY